MMRQVHVVQAESGATVAASVALADSFRQRLRGLLARPPLQRDEGLLLLHCDAVHTVGMRYPIDVAFLDADGMVVRSIAALEPWRLGFGGPAAVHALELPVGRLGETCIGPGVHLSWT